LPGIWNAGLLERSCLEVAETREFGLGKSESSSSFRSISTKFNQRAGPLIHLQLNIYSPPKRPPHQQCTRHGRTATLWPGLSNSRSSSFHCVANPGGPPGKTCQLSKKVKDRVQIHVQPPKPHDLPTLGCFPIVTAFIEGLVFILVHRSDRLRYLRR